MRTETTRGPQAIAHRSARNRTGARARFANSWSRLNGDVQIPARSTIRAVSVTTQPSFQSGPPRTVAELDFLSSSESLANLDVAPDGRLLLVRCTSQTTYDDHVNVILGWGDALRRAQGEERE